MTYTRDTSDLLLFKPSKALQCCWNLFKIGDNNKEDKIEHKNLYYLENRKLITSDDLNFLKSLEIANVETCKTVTADVTNSQFKNLCRESDTDNNEDILLTLRDLYWIFHKLGEINKTNDNNKCHFHEVFRGTEIIFPTKQSFDRNENLEDRCKTLRIKQENKRYANIVKNVVGIGEVEDKSFAEEMKILNRYIIAIVQFVITVISGFVFGMFGVEWFVGPLDIGQRIMCGIFFAIVIAVAEIYFMLKLFSETDHCAKKNL